uniref:Uncharacterized protein n=1 Tax=Lepeophtheirus salmonis TaxID=72036 RepID=A0A0K2UJN2_LEPSM
MSNIISKMMLFFTFRPNRVSNKLTNSFVKHRLGFVEVNKIYRVCSSRISYCKVD